MNSTMPEDETTLLVLSHEIDADDEKEMRFGLFVTVIVVEI